MREIHINFTDPRAVLTHFSRTKQTCPLEKTRATGAKRLHGRKKGVCAMNERKKYSRLGSVEAPKIKKSVRRMCVDHLLFLFLFLDF